MEEDEEDGEQELEPPSEELVAHRALCLGRLIMIGEFASIIRDIKMRAVSEIYDDIINRAKERLRSEGLVEYMSQNEISLLRKPPEEWTKQELIDTGWRTESLVVILWALSLIDSLPSYDQPFVERDVLRTLRIVDPVGEFMARVMLRPNSEIAQARRIAERWHWRARTTYIQRRGAEPPDGWTFPEIIRLVAEKSHENGDIPEPIGDDFPAFGKSYALLPDEEYSTAQSVAHERHFALNWLCGYSEDWDKTPTDT